MPQFSRLSPSAHTGTWEQTGNECTRGPEPSLCFGLGLPGPLFCRRKLPFPAPQLYLLWPTSSSCSCSLLPQPLQWLQPRNPSRGKGNPGWPPLGALLSSSALPGCPPSPLGQERPNIPALDLPPSISSPPRPHHVSGPGALPLSSQPQCCNLPPIPCPPAERGGGPGGLWTPHTGCPGVGGCRELWTSELLATDLVTEGHTLEGWSNSGPPLLRGPSRGTFTL